MSNDAMNDFPASQPPSYPGTNEPFTQQLGEMENEPKKKGCMRPGCIIPAAILAFFALGVCCCGGFILSFYSSFQRAVDTTPEEAQQRADAIIQLELPEEFRAVFAFDWGFLGVMDMDAIIFEGGSSQNAVIVIGYGGVMGARASADVAGQGAMRDQSRQFLEGAKGEQPDPTLREEIRTREATILGEPVEVQITEIMTPEDEVMSMMVSAVIPTDDGLAVVMFQVNPEDYTEDELIAVLENAKPGVSK